MTPWQWWASSACGRDEGEWELGELDSRDAAIAAGNLEYVAGEPFYVIEARSSTHAKYWLWEIGDIVALIEKAEAKLPTKRGPYKKRVV